MSKTVRILVTGSREYSDEKFFQKIFHEADTRLRRKGVESFILVSGGCRGADLLAEKVCSHLGWFIERHNAQWDKHGKRAGFIRNKEMIDSGIDYCFAFPRGESKGTRMTIRLCENKKIKTRIFES